MDPSLIVAALLGLLAGLFVNYASDVLPRTRRFSRPVCRDCNTPFSWSDYLMFRACRNCGVVRNLRTWIVMILIPVGFVLVWMYPPRALGLALSLIVLTYFAVITVIDLEHRLILFPTVIFGALLGAAVGTYIHSRANGLAAALGASLLGGLFGFACMYLLYTAGSWLVRYRRRRLESAGQEADDEEVLGGGDVYLAGVLGLMVGWPYVVNALVYGVLVGGAASIAVLLAQVLRGRYSSAAFMTFIPYGPYLIFGAFYVLFFP
jgi:prepilin signal peptidase PulO-like enzyme (type II secretory pathway)